MANPRRATSSPNHSNEVYHYRNGEKHDVGNPENLDMEAGGNPTVEDEEWSIAESRLQNIVL